MPPDPNPTPDQLLAMSYADGELDADQRGAFEARLALEPSLAREVSELQALAVLARSAAPPEPADHEWARLDLDPLQRAGVQAGWMLAIAGAIGLAAYIVYSICAASDIGVPVKACLLAAIGGALLLLLMTVRERLSLLPYDPYRRVQR
jgi:anti-sigma factor RsiW